MSWRLATRLVARWTAPIWVRSPNFSTVAIRLTTTAANSSYTLWRCGSPRAPMKNAKFKVAASSTKEPKITFSRFMAAPRRTRLSHRTAEDDRRRRKRLPRSTRRTRSADDLDDCLHQVHLCAVAGPRAADLGRLQ